MTQKIRPSEFVLTYGPGAILESQDGPVIIPDPKRGMFFEGSDFENPANYVIDDQKLSQGLLPKNSKIFELPTNASVALKDDEDGTENIIYKTKPFPKWYLCLNRKGHAGDYDILYQSNQCPKCKDPTAGRKGAIRFVMACNHGHLDEVSWSYLIHGSGPNSCSHTSVVKGFDQDLMNKSTFFWKRVGSTLKDIDIECPRCEKSVNLGDAYYGEFSCRGRNPHRESTNPGAEQSEGTCKVKTKMMQRQALHLRIPEIKTLLTISSSPSTLYNIMQRDDVKKIATLFKNTQGGVTSKSKFEEFIGFLTASEFEGATISAFKRFMEGEMWKQAKDAMDDSFESPPNNYHEIIKKEMKSIFYSSQKGCPPQGDSRTTIFEMPYGQIEPMETSNKTKFIVAPATKLQTVLIQMGFRRNPTFEKSSDGESKKEYIKPKLVYSSFKKGDYNWFPGTRFLGEGLFIRLAENDGWHDGLVGNSVSKWMDNMKNSAEYEDYVFRDGKNSRDEMHPGFVWWHTLSHLLVREISDDSGYSAASIRERIYFESSGEKFLGGILLYASQPGTDGTLGGLSGLSSSLEGYLNNAISKISYCSGDPLCEEQTFSPGGYNGAACYGCLMNSETSCEHRNMWLDRSILVENVP
jgi:hypothetical protein